MIIPNNNPNLYAVVIERDCGWDHTIARSLSGCALIERGFIRLDLHPIVGWNIGDDNTITPIPAAKVWLDQNMARYHTNGPDVFLREEMILWRCEHLVREDEVEL